MMSGLAALAKLYPIIAMVAVGLLWVGHTDGKIAALSDQMQQIIQIQNQQSNQLNQISQKIAAIKHVN